MLRNMIAWDYGLRLTNSLFDQAAAACRFPTRKERQTACGEIRNKIHQLDDEFHSASKLLFSPRRSAAQQFIVMFFPGFSAVRNAEDIAAMRFEIIKLAFALAEYHADRGTFPEKLDDLVPKYVETVQKDIFNNDADLHYAKHGDGYSLYSIGDNGIDDGGKGVDDCKEGDSWDDLGVRISGSKGAGTVSTPKRSENEPAPSP